MRKTISGIVVIFVLPLIFLRVISGMTKREPSQRGKGRSPRSTCPFPLDSYNLSLCDDHTCEEDGNERKVYQ